MITRFAPSPTGPLHLGHAYSALLAHDMAEAARGRFLLRIEDIDQTRSRPAWEEQIYEDLTWLGLTWPRPVRRQSDQLDAYRAALNVLWQSGLLYVCHCTRRDIHAAAQAPQEGALTYGPDGLIYPGTCRPAQMTNLPSAPLPAGQVLRLDMAKAAKVALGSGPLWFDETGGSDVGANGTISIDEDRLIAEVGDIVLSRRDFLGSYHLSVVVDDAAQQVSHVVRGRDLFEATVIHVLLQRLLGLKTPRYHHHRLIRDDAGKRLAKRDDARAIARYRADGASPADIRRLVGL